MAQRKSHPQVEFVVELANGKEQTYRSFAEATHMAVALAASNGSSVNIDVLIYSVAGARWWGGDHAVEEYKADPDASISDRIAITAEAQGRIA